MIAIAETFNNTNLALWQKYVKDPLTALYPEIYSEPPEKPILFLSFNPSFAEGQTAKLLQHIPDIKIAGVLRDYFSFTGQIDAEKVANLQTYDDYAKLHHPYYTVPNKLAKSVGLTPYHLDVFQIRVTKQNTFNTDVDFKGSKGLDLQLKPLPEFLAQQLEAVFTYLQAIKPQLIIVINATASKMFYTLWKDRLQLSLDEQVGHYWFTGDNRCPLVFTGMLSGGRQLDIFSRQKLFWNIKKIVQKLE